MDMVRFGMGLGPFAEHLGRRLLAKLLGDLRGQAEVEAARLSSDRETPFPEGENEVIDEVTHGGARACGFGNDTSGTR